MIIKPLISLYGDNEYSYLDHPNVMFFVTHTESIYGILDRELQSKVYKEYTKNRTTYDLAHNREYGFILLKFQIPRLLHTCKVNTIPPNKDWISLVERELSLSQINLDLYPVFPKQAWDDIKGFSLDVKPYIDKIDSSEKEIFFDKWENTRKREFYINWELIIKDDSWFKHWVSESIRPLESLVTSNAIFNNLLDRRVKEIHNLVKEEQKSKDSNWWSKLFH